MFVGCEDKQFFFDNTIRLEKKTINCNQFKYI